ncbi:hypothetical protein B0T25DRAFT_569853 [Lasiosphaeria hispida]|uniref:Uncharacterized protein n=1 Tax=Lasiosphaeria hispida TaxID=260671 RepID=A0AAJ0HEK4_9PEZI|nr:hypothetical protein B0T25DRAFT_569853 [Lasiosphaeria hispida]
MDSYTLNLIAFRPSASKHFDPATYRCVHSYSIELLSIDPLAIYINNFLSNDDYLLDLAKDGFTQFLATSNGTDISPKPTVRLSQWTQTGSTLRRRRSMLIAASPRVLSGNESLQGGGVGHGEPHSG